MIEPKVLERIEESIRLGAFADARSALEKAVPKRINRSDRVRLAHLAARVGQPQLGLRWLRSCLHSTPSRRANPTEEEIVEYTLCLVRVGSIYEAERVFANAKSEAFPQKLFVGATLKIAQWDYQAAIPKLRSYVNWPDLPEYARLVGLLNLASALVYEKQFEELPDLLKELLSVSADRSYTLLLANAREIAAASAVYRADYEEAAELVSEAEASLAGTGSIYEFFNQKWRAFLELVEGRSQPLTQFRAAAVQRGHWESVREADRFQAVWEGNLTLARHLYAGTPHVAYRKRLLEFFPDLSKIELYYDWAMGPANRIERKGQTWDLLWRTLPDQPSLKWGQVAHRLLQAISFDFYRSASIAALHERLYPGDFYNPDSSPKRMHAQVGRVRRWLVKQNLPFEILEDHGQYRLDAVSPVRFRVKVAPLSQKEIDDPLDELRIVFGKSPFSATQASEVLSIHIRSTNRLLAEGIEESTLTREGRGRATRYRFAA